MPSRRFAVVIPQGSGNSNPGIYKTLEFRLRRLIAPHRGFIAKLLRRYSKENKQTRQKLRMNSSTFEQWSTLLKRNLRLERISHPHRKGIIKDVIIYYPHLA